MNYACLSCGAKYSIPDTRVNKAGADGLRVRCSRCRAIMAVSTSMAKGHRGADDRNDVFARTGGVSAAVASTPLVTGVMKNPFAEVAVPSSFSLGSMDGGAGQAISREVTGIFMPMLASVEGAVDNDSMPPTSTSTSTTTAKKLRADIFYCAIEGRARGPFTSREMLMLAEKGKVRAGTLMWKPGATGWKPLKHVAEFDVSFLIDAVRTRKQREREAAILAEKRLGISPVRLERQTVRPLSSSSRAGSPPSLPFDAFYDDVDAGNQTQSGFSSVHEPSAWRVPGAPEAPEQPRVRPWVVALAAAVVATAAFVAFF